MNGIDFVDDSKKQLQPHRLRYCQRTFSGFVGVRRALHTKSSQSGAVLAFLFLVYFLSQHPVVGAFDGLIKLVHLLL